MTLAWTQIKSGEQLFSFGKIKPIVIAIAYRIRTRLNQIGSFAECSYKKINECWFQSFVLKKGTDVHRNIANIHETCGGFSRFEFKRKFVLKAMRIEILCEIEACCNDISVSYQDIVQADVRPNGGLKWVCWIRIGAVSCLKCRIIEITIHFRQCRIVLRLHSKRYKKFLIMVFGYLTKDAEIEILTKDFDSIADHKMIVKPP